MSGCSPCSHGGNKRQVTKPWFSSLADQHNQFLKPTEYQPSRCQRSESLRLRSSQWVLFALNYLLGLWWLAMTGSYNSTLYFSYPTWFLVLVDGLTFKNALINISGTFLYPWLLWIRVLSVELLQREVGPFSSTTQFPFQVWLNCLPQFSFSVLPKAPTFPTFPNLNLPVSWLQS